MPNDENLPKQDLPLTAAQARRLVLASFIFGGLAIVANGITAMGFVPQWAMQLAGGSAGIFTGLSWYCARQGPASGSQPRKED